MIKDLILPKNPKYNGYKRSRTSVVYKLFDKKPAASHTETGTTWNSDSENHQLAGEWHEPIIRKFEKYRVYSSFKGNNISGS